MGGNPRSLETALPHPSTANNCRLGRGRTKGHRPNVMQPPCRRPAPPPIPDRPDALQAELQRQQQTQLAAAQAAFAEERAQLVRRLEEARPGGRGQAAVRIDGRCAIAPPPDDPSDHKRRPNQQQKQKHSSALGVIFDLQFPPQHLILEHAGFRLVFCNPAKFLLQRLASLIIPPKNFECVVVCLVPCPQRSQQALQDALFQQQARPLPPPEPVRPALPFSSRGVTPFHPACSVMSYCTPVCPMPPPPVGEHRGLAKCWTRRFALGRKNF